jgi:hypothetical protein
MAKKGDLGLAFQEYSGREAEAVRAKTAGDFAAVLQQAQSAIPLLRDTIAYLRRYHKVLPAQLWAIELILQYAPPMFSRRSLDKVSAWLADTNRTERAAYPDLPARLETAWRRLSLAARIWPSIVASPVLATPADDPSEVRQIMAFWVKYGAVTEQVIAGRSHFRLTTHRDCAIRAKCAKCGHLAHAKWSEMLGNKQCHRCRTNSPIAFVAREA